MSNLPQHLDPSGGDIVKQESTTGRWFITLGHAGFNTPANNGKGYTSREGAMRAHFRCSPSKAGEG